ncbi:MAG: hypothetical protein ACOCTP_02975 [Roseicyclus sp.]
MQHELATGGGLVGRALFAAIAEAVNRRAGDDALRKRRAERAQARVRGALAARFVLCSRRAGWESGHADVPPRPITRAARGHGAAFDHAGAPAALAPRSTRTIPATTGPCRPGRASPRDCRAPGRAGPAWRDGTHVTAIRQGLAAAKARRTGRAAHARHPCHHRAAMADALFAHAAENRRLVAA